MLVPIFFPTLALPALVLVMSLPLLARPSRSAYLNEHTDSFTRATVLSTVSFVMSVTRIPLLLGAGVIADAVSPVVAMALVGGLILVGGTLVVAVDWPLTTPPEDTPSRELSSEASSGD